MAGSRSRRGRRGKAGAPPLPDGAVVVDKPPGIGSYDVIRRLAPLLGRTKTGFVGTLDPFATGVLPLVLGEATKLVPFLLDESKEYEATVRLGTRTSTGDPTGEVVARAPIPEVEASGLERATARFLGEIEQVPPMYSALRSGGERLYEKARRGEEVEREPRRVSVHELELAAPPEQPGVLTLRVVCSSGTYVRVLGEDLARALGTEGHLASLRRTRVGSFTLRHAALPEALLAGGRVALVEDRLVPLDELAPHLPELRLGSRDAQRIGHGGAIELPADGPDAPLVRLRRDDGCLVAIARRVDGRLEPVRVLNRPGACADAPSPGSS